MRRPFRGIEGIGGRGGRVDVSYSIGNRSLVVRVSARIESAARDFGVRAAANSLISTGCRGEYCARTWPRVVVGTARTIEVPQWRHLVIAIAAEIDDAVEDKPVEEEISLGCRSDSSFHCRVSRRAPVVVRCAAIVP